LDPNLFLQECTKFSLIQEKWSLKKAQVFMQSSFFAQNHKERRRGRRKEAAAEEQETEAEDNDDDEDEDVQANLQSEDFYHQQSCTDAQNSGSALCSNCKKKKKLSLL
jgi:hypothetical protein